MDLFGVRALRAEVDVLRGRIEWQEAMAFTKSPGGQAALGEFAGMPSMAMPMPSLAAVEKQLHDLENRVADLTTALEAAGVVHYRRSGFVAGADPGRRLTAKEAGAQEAGS